MLKQSVDLEQSVVGQRAAQRGNIADSTRREHDEQLHAIHQLERRLASAAPGRERDWAGEVLVDLCRLRDAFRRHVESSNSGAGLFEELTIACPNWASRIERLQQRAEGLLQHMESLISQIDHHGPHDIPDFSEIRRRTAALIEEARTIYAQENDLIFECFLTDLGVGD